jgi:hypothetical protein
MTQIDGKYYADDAAELASWLSIEIPTATQLRQRKVLPPREPGKGYPLRESVTAYIEYQRARTPKGRPASQKTVEEKGLKEQYMFEQVREKKRKNDEADDLLIHVEQVVRIIDELVNIIRPRLESLPGNVQKFVPAGRAAEITKREIAKITKAISSINFKELLKNKGKNEH